MGKIVTERVLAPGMSEEWKRPSFHDPLWRLCENSLRTLFGMYFRAFHRITIEGLERVPRTFDRLIVIANHASYLDGLIIWTYLRLPFRIVVNRAVASNPWLRPLLNNRYTVPLDFMNAYAVKGVIRMVEAGFPLLIFPEGRRTSTGHLMKIYDGTGFVAYRTGAEILPIYLKNTFNSLFARKHAGRRLFARIGMTIGEVRPPLRLDHLPNREKKGAAREMIYEMLSNLYLEAHTGRCTLGREFIRLCKENGRRMAFADSTGSRVSYAAALHAAFALGRYLSYAAKGNIAIMLPNLTVTALVFMGLQIYRRAAVLINYSAGPRAVSFSMDLAEVGTVVTSRQFLDKLKVSAELLQGRRCIYMEDLKQAIGGTDKARALFRSVFSGSFRNVRTGDERQTAIVLFTSGSEGIPKGVPLSHENIITNVYQGLSRIDVTPQDRFLNVLPMFHSFGLTVGTIIPLFARASIFFHVSPLHYRIVPELAYDRECTILLATNTFLKGYGRRGHPYDFRSMRYIFCGGESLTDEVFEHYAKTFGVRVMSGYGATECSPMVSINSALQYEHGTVGKPMPGIEYRVDPVEGIGIEGGTAGRLFVRGKNVMQGYLKNEEANRKYLVDDGGWYDTGDVVQVTGRGSLKILGRMKRFAKVSGEMISLTAVEEVLNTALGSRKEVSVMAVPDDVRGESLILVTANEGIERKTVRDALRQYGFSELAVPREVRIVKEMPRLATGKIDYVKLKELTGPR